MQSRSFRPSAVSVFPSLSVAQKCYLSMRGSEARHERGSRTYRRDDAFLPGSSAGIKATFLGNGSERVNRNGTATATRRRVSCNRWLPLGSDVLHHRHDVAVRVLDPRSRRAARVREGHSPVFNPYPTLKVHYSF